MWRCLLLDGLPGSEVVLAGDGPLDVLGGDSRSGLALGLDEALDPGI